MRAAARAVLLLCSLGLASARVLLEVLAPHQPHTSLLQRPVKGVRCSSATFAAQLRPPLRAARGAREVNLVSRLARVWQQHRPLTAGGAIGEIWVRRLSTAAVEAGEWGAEGRNGV